MIVNSTEIKNNFGKYLRMSIKEDIIITSNGRKIARLVSYEENCMKDDTNSRVNEGSAAYEVLPADVTYEEFLEIRENSEQRLEYIGGKIYLLASPRTTHQIVLNEINVILFDWFRGKKCRPIIAPYDIMLQKKSGEKNMVQPDLMVICDLEENLNEKDYYTGIPALVMEIVSEGTRSRDFVEKMDLYMLSGVKEYWIVNPISKEIAVFHFEEYGITSNTTFKGQERAVSYIFDGLGVDVESIFR